MTDPRLCPDCSSASKTLDVRSSPHHTYRRRECKNCPRRWSTWEVNPERIESLVLEVSRLQGEVAAKEIQLTGLHERLAQALAELKQLRSSTTVNLKDVMLS